MSFLCHMAVRARCRCIGSREFSTHKPEYRLRLHSRQGCCSCHRTQPRPSQSRQLHWLCMRSSHCNDSSTTQLQHMQCNSELTAGTAYERMLLRTGHTSGCLQHCITQLRAMPVCFAKHSAACLQGLRHISDSADAV